MKLLRLFLSLMILSVPFASVAQQQNDGKIAYISDELFIYFHSGPGTQYRILGSMDAGEEVTLIGGVQNGYQQLVDSKNRNGWVDAKYVSSSPGLKIVVSELNGDLAEQVSTNNTLESQLSEANGKINELQTSFNQLQKQHDVVTQQYQTAAEALDNKELNIMLTWFIYGGGVMAIGIIMGLIIPRFAARRRSNYSSWG
ncbi:TIGR04211 family SH3 domain-containing protein [Thalassotalea sp. Y01]|uniref:TIGR04211 family SH3 domain-containing protein n=1 Tax=Thalassotalea sp. Y01 TaxID=2729613 RepID=UPI00145D2533|nr:TIGR04211 family SH3 domain-containing protein [Thalassotalea sp. Y01]NMP15138.1 TIGR04211 family SH3 domain-containing protein [Thalassotalea sp. Y01]